MMAASGAWRPRLRHAAAVAPGLEITRAMPREVAMRVSIPVIVVLCLALAGISFAADEVGSPVVAAEPEPAGGTPLVLKLVRHDTSPELRTMIENEAPQRKTITIHRDPVGPPDVNALPDDWQGKTGIRHSEHVLQRSTGRSAMPTPSVNVQGLGYGMPGYIPSGVPPDTTGGVGRDYYIQWVNTDYAFFNKDGSMVDLPGANWRPGNTLWSGFGGLCEFTNYGDPIALYDQIEDRWVLTQFGLASAASGPHSQCVAVSETSDPLGSWHRYEYEWPSNYLNDYPKMGIWSDGYYFSANQFQCTNWSNCNWRGAGVAVMEKEAMMQGQAAGVQYWHLGSNFGHLLPADIDGDTPPPQGAPGMYFGASLVFGQASLKIWEAAINWDNPDASTFGSNGVQPNTSMSVTNYSISDDIPQQGTAHVLDAMSYRLMFRAPYRNFGTHESVVLTQTINTPAAKRWYELRDPAGATPILHQEGTFTPDGNGRWMGSIAMDALGNIALGYSVSGSSMYPSIRVVGRNADDPLGQMTYSEEEIQAGSGFQIPLGGRNRWGDYSTMSIDPSDDCTFWYTQEYLASTGQIVWRTRVAAFAFPECVAVMDPIFEDGFESGDTSAWE
jgi:hypothetical protein